MDLNIIREEVEILMEDFNKSFPNSMLLNANSNLMKMKLTDAFNKLFLDKKITKDNETLIHSRLLAILDKTTVHTQLSEKVDIDVNADIDYVEQMMTTYGDELGAFLLLSNQLISNVCAKVSKKYGKRIKNIQKELNK